MVHPKRYRRYVLAGVVTGLVVAGLLLVLYGSAGAAGATINVNTTDDELNADSDCSLREAVQAANTDIAVDGCTAGSGADTIVLPAGTYRLTLAGADENGNASGDLDILSDVTIEGAGAATTKIQATGRRSDFLGGPAKPVRFNQGLGTLQSRSEVASGDCRRYTGVNDWCSRHLR